MNPDQIIGQAKAKLEAGLERFIGEVKKLRTGRAHPGMVESVSVEVYGQQTPLAHVSTISAPEAQLIQITPFDPNNLQAIVAAIRDNQSLGMNPMDDGRVVRVPIPPLTAERRQQIVKQLNEKVEESMIGMRAIRHDVLKDIDEAKKDKDIGEDEHKRLKSQMDDLMSEYKNKVDAEAAAREKEILTV